MLGPVFVRALFPLRRDWSESESLVLGSGILLDVCRACEEKVGAHAGTLAGLRCVGSVSESLARGSGVGSETLRSGSRVLEENVGALAGKLDSLRRIDTAVDDARRDDSRLRRSSAVERFREPLAENAPCVRGPSPKSDESLDASVRLVGIGRGDNPVAAVPSSDF